MTNDQHRLFIAIELPAETQSALANVQRALSPLAAVRWTNTANIHLTLQFLGDTDTALIPALSAALAETVAAVPVFSLSLATVGAFPNLKRPRIIWAGVGTSAALTALHRAVTTATATVNIPADKKPFKPHLTIGRVRNRARGGDFRAIAAAVSRENIGEIATVRVAHISLIRSQLTRRGPIYTPLAEFQLQK